MGYRFDDIRSLRGDVECDIKFKTKNTFNRIWNHRTVQMVSSDFYWDGVVLPHVDCDDAPTLLHGVAKRMGSKLREIIMPEYYPKLKAHVQKMCRREFQQQVGDVDLSFETWISKTNYPLWRKNELREVYQALLDEFECVKHKEGKSLLHYMVSIFCKDECYVDFKAARGIYARDDIAKVVFGPWFKAIEEIVYQHPAFIKHVPVHMRAKYIFDLMGAEGKVFLQSDYSSFERHFIRERMLNCEFVVYDYVMGNIAGWDYMREHMLNVLTNINVCASKHFTAKIEARRMSGEMNTSLGNGIFNYMNMTFMFSELLGKDLVPGVVEGDDGLFGYEGNIEDVDRMNKWFADSGCNIKLLIHNKLSDASFCGLLFDEEDKEIITDPFKILAKIGWVNRKYTRSSEKKIKHLMRVKAMSTLVQYPKCPIISSLAKCVMRLTKSYDVRYYAESEDLNTYERDQFIFALKNWKNFLHSEVGYNTRLKFAELYNIPVQVQLDVEKYFDSKESYSPFHNAFLYDVVNPTYKDNWEAFVRTYADSTVVETDTILLET